MPLNSNQQAALDAFVDTLAPAATPPAAPDALWFRPTPMQTAAFAAAHGLTPLKLFGDDQTKIAPAPNFNADEFKVRAAFGYAPSGVRRVWTVHDLQLTRDFSDRLNTAPNAPALEALCENSAAEGVETDAVIAAVMLKATVIDPYSFMKPVYKVPSPDLSYFPARTLSDVAAYLLQTDPIVPPGVE